MTHIVQLEATLHIQLLALSHDAIAQHLIDVAIDAARTRLTLYACMDALATLEQRRLRRKR